MVIDVSGEPGAGDPDPCSSSVHLVLSSKGLRFVSRRLHTTETPLLRVLRLPSLFRAFYYSPTSPTAHRPSLFPCPARLGTALLRHSLEESAALCGEPAACLRPVASLRPGHKRQAATAQLQLRRAGEAESKSHLKHSNMQE